MNAAETISAAIDALERRRDAAPAGPWAWRDDFGDHGDTGLALTNAAGDEIIGAYNWHCCSFRDDPTVADGAADLIATLHRTIDAQLAILRAELDFVARCGWPTQPFPERLAVLALADAILGSDS